MQNRQPPAFIESLEEKAHSKFPVHSEKALKTFVSLVNGLFHLFPWED